MFSLDRKNHDNQKQETFSSICDDIKKIDNQIFLLRQSLLKVYKLNQIKKINQNINDLYDHRADLLDECKNQYQHDPVYGCSCL